MFHLTIKPKGTLCRLTSLIFAASLILCLNLWFELFERLTERLTDSACSQPLNPTNLTTATDAFAMLEPFPICIGILAYDGKQTLEETLRSFSDSGLFSAVKKALIHFQKIDSPARQQWMEAVLLDHPALQATFTFENIEFEGFLRMAKRCQEEYFITIEEDFKIVPENYHLVSIQISSAIAMVQGGTAAIFLRSRSIPGLPDYARQSFERGELGKQFLLHHSTWNYDAERDFHEISQCRETPKYWCASTRHASFTNNPVLYKTSFYVNLLERSTSLRYKDIEPTITKHWKALNLTVSRSLGIFTHERIDRWA